MVEKPDLHILDENEGIAEDLFELYRGDDTRFGTFDIDRLRLVDDKVEMKDDAGDGPRDVKRPPKVADVLAHLEGRRPIGIWPARKDGMTRRVVIDIDGKDVTGGYKAISQVAIVKKCEKLGLSFLVDSLSKSGGVHLDCFLTEWVPQARAYALGRQMAVRLGFPKCEIFPPESGTENWVILPYFGGAMPGKHSKQYCLSREPGKLWMTLPEFRDFAKASPVTPEAVEAAVRKARPEKDTDGPARAKRDLEAFAAEIAGAADGTRGKLLNKRAFQMGTMVGAKWIEESEVFDTLMEAAGKCGVTPSDATMHIGNGLRDGKKEKPRDEVAEAWPVYEQVFVTEDGDKSTYRLVVGGKTIPAISMAAWLDPTKFNALAGHYLEDTYRVLSKDRDRWRVHVTEARRTAEPDPLVANVSRDDMFVELLNEFIHNTQLARERDGILMRRAWLDDEAENPAAHRYYFRLRDVQNFLSDAHTPEFYSPKRNDIAARIRQLGGDDVPLKLEGRAVRCFWVPVAAVGAPWEPRPVRPTPTHEV